MIRSFRFFDPPKLEFSDCGLALGFNHSVESLTRDVPVKPLHSHNDYWRKQPLFDALSVGAQSIESDIWVYNESLTIERTYTETSRAQEECGSTDTFKSNEIYVGHSKTYLEPENTLSSMYLDPLLYFLDYANPSISHFDGNGEVKEDSEGTKNGVFYDSAESPLYLWFDFKTDPTITYKALKTLVKPFIDRGYLAFFDTEAKKFVPGPLVLTITGNLPKKLVEKETKRYLFLDAPLNKFDSEDNELEQYKELSVIASASVSDVIGEAAFKNSKLGGFDNASSEKLAAAINTAHQLNFKTRLWGDIDWPTDARNKHLSLISSLGSDLLNVDDLEYASNVF